MILVISYLDISSLAEVAPWSFQPNLKFVVGASELLTLGGIFDALQLAGIHRQSIQLTN